MKKCFFNEDGTIKTVRAVILVDVLTFILLLVIFMGQFKDQDLTPVVTTTTKSTTTTTIKVCNNCSIKFNRESMTMEPNSTYALEDIVDLVGVDIHNVKFNISDTSLASMESIDGKTHLVAKNTLGSFTLTAKYLEMEESITVTISTSTLNSISFKNLAYYVYQDELIDIGITTDPVGYDISNVSISIDDESVASIEDNKIKGKKLGKTVIRLNNNGEEIKANLYVVNNKIIIKKKENYIYQETDIIEYSTKEEEILLTIEGENNNLTNEDISVEIEDLGTFTTEVNYVGKSTSMDNTYIYRISNKSTSSKKMEDNYSLVYFKLSSGEIKELKIERNG